MNLAVVLTAEQPEDNSAMVVGTVAGATGGGKCIQLSVPLAAKTAKYRSSPETGDPCTARTATLRLGDSYQRRAVTC
jgi:hypothetical protein